MHKYTFSIKRCPSPDECDFVLGDGKELLLFLESLLCSSSFPAKVKIAIATCPRCCTMPKVRDVGFVATTSGWEVYFGGNGGAHPRIGTLVAKKLNSEQAAILAKKCLHIYTSNCTKKLRTSTFIDRFGENRFLEKIGLINSQSERL